MIRSPRLLSAYVEVIQKKFYVPKYESLLYSNEIYERIYKFKFPGHHYFHSLKVVKLAIFPAPSYIHTVCAIFFFYFDRKLHLL